MTTQVEVITSVERRRRWSRAEKERIVAAAMEPGAVGSPRLWCSYYLRILQVD
jgi:transposase-like protein